MNRGAQQDYRAPRYSAPSGPYYYGGRSYAPYAYRRPVFVQPYYAFRPRTTFSFGFSIGYGVPYPWARWQPYGYYNYGFPITTGYAVRDYYNRVGGVSFDLEPYWAALFVDGRFVGYAGDFGPSQMPLTLQRGTHRIDVRAEGYRTVSFDVHITAGQVIPYRGDMAYAW